MKLPKIVTVVVLLLSGCASTDNNGNGYKFGDLSKSYCSSTDPEFRKTVKAMMSAAGINVGVDYCFTVGLVDAMIQLNKNEQ